MKSVARVLVALAVVIASAVAAAQTQVVAPTAAQRCLTRGGVTLGTPTYPQAAFDRREGGRVAVELEFNGSDTPPELKIIESEGGSLFEDAVRTFATDYRVPCLERGQKAQIRQDFVFRPTDGRRVYFSEPIDREEQRQAVLKACVRHLRPAEKPNYPRSAERKGEHGTVVLKLEYHDALSQPRVAVLERAGSATLAAAARLHAEGYRMPCHEGTPVEVVHYYTYQLEGDARVVLTDMSLTTFLRGTKGIARTVAYFDFNSMGCPFDVRITLHRPYSPNLVAEVESRHPERRFFLDWLRRQELNLDAAALNAVLGQDFTLSVPCTILDLGNTPGGGASK